MSVAQAVLKTRDTSRMVAMVKCESTVTGSISTIERSDGGLKPPKSELYDNYCLFVIGKSSLL